MIRDEYKGLVLHSEDEDGHLHPPSLTNWFLMQSILVEMQIEDRTIQMTSARNEPIRYALTDKGRDAAARTPKTEGAME